MADAADARRRAEEALANFERFVFIGGPAHPDKPYHDAGVNLATALRALLAAGPEAKAPREYGPCPNYREGQSHAGCNLCGGLGTLPILSDADIAPPPTSDAVRDAAEALTVCCDVCEADRRQPCVTVTTGDPAPYPHPERAVAAALAARGGE